MTTDALPPGTARLIDAVNELTAALRAIADRHGLTELEVAAFHADQVACYMMREARRAARRAARQGTSDG